jgi:O-antigen ligase
LTAARVTLDQPAAGPLSERRALDATRYRITSGLCALTCLLAPAYTVRWHFGPLPTTLLEAVTLLTIAAFLVETAAHQETLVWRSPYLLPGLLFVLAGAISVWTAPSRVQALGLYRAYLLEPMAFAFVVTNVVRTPARALLVVSGLFAGGLVVGLANSVVVAQALAHHTYNVTQTPPVVVYMTANAVALYAGPVAAFAGALALHASGRARLVGLAAFALCLPVVVLSFSRGGYLALAAVVVGLALSHRRRLLLLVAAVAGVLALAIVPPVRTRVLIEIHNSYGSSVDSRLDLWRAAVSIIRERPLVGAGLFGFPARSAPFFTHLHTAASFIDPHNIVLNFWIETGLLGLLAIAWVIGAAIVLGVLGWMRLPAAWRPYPLGAALAMVAVIVHGMVDVPYFKNDLALEFWALIAVAWAGWAWGQRSPAAGADPADAPASRPASSPS